MVSLRDARGLRVTAGGRDAVELLDGAVTAYLGARADTRERVGRLLSADPGCVMGHVLDGYLAMLSSKREGTERARDAWAVAASVARRARASRREVLHVEALDAWSRGDMRAVVRYWDALLADYPRDILALKASQFVLSYLGESGRMRDTVERALPAWDPGVPGYGFVLGCHAYALEEAGDYAPAEETGRRAVELNRADIWAAHAVAHVAEMQGRLREGIAWVALLAGEWGQCSNFAFHLRWHEGLYHLDLEEYGRVLELYDREVRAQPSDEYLDITNAVSLLWRLEQAEVDVGPRWHELAERARAHLDDHALVFVDVHYLMALVAARDDAAAGRFLESCERFAAAGAGTEAAVMADVGLPLARGAWAHRRGVYGEAVDLLLPIRSRVREIGGSHAQRDVFEQMLIDAAWRAGQLATAAALLEERVTRRPDNPWGWRHRAAVLDALGSSAAAATARRAHDRLRARQAGDASAA